MKKIVVLFALSLLVGFSKPPKNTENICHVFQENPTWYSKAKQTESKWGVPVAVQMAIMHQESHFNGEASAKTSTAYGFSQALNNTWSSYQRSTGSQGRRNEFAAATDFIGWYVNISKRQLGIKKDNAYALYLAYHEGLGGYKNHSYKHKPMLVTIAKKVHQKAGIFQSQLSAC